jgi:glyoxylase-like metal-dependent hydrolase (beta-lactamase superfamily II)
VLHPDLCYDDGITAVDTGYVRERLDASHLIVERGRGAFVDTGTTPSVPYLLAALSRAGLAPEAVDWIFLTHVHLDHAGGAGALARALPNARVLVHPRGKEHLVAPEKLIGATRRVYGDERYDRLYGTIYPIAEARIEVAEEGGRYLLNGRAFDCLYTPGHAQHHYALYDHGARSVFAGDTFGVSYRELDVDGREFVMPASTPTQFDPDQYKHSVDRMLALNPKHVFVTHYGRLNAVARLGVLLKRGIDAFADIAVQHGPAGEEGLRRALYAHLSRELDAHGFARDDARRHAILDDDIELDAQGLIAWLARRAKSQVA